MTVAVLVALALGHATGGPAEATGDGEFTANVSVVIQGNQIECVIEGFVEGESHAVEGTEAWDVTDNLVGTSGLCPQDPNDEGDDLVQEVIEGTVIGRVTEDEPNGNGIADGMASGEFEINLTSVQSTTLGELSTDKPAQITCPEINLDLSPTTYTCTLIDETVLYGDIGEATIAKMEVTFTGEPNYFDRQGTPIDPHTPTPGVKGEPPVGSGPGSSSSGSTYAMFAVVLALAGASLLGAGFVARRRP
jgi:hypothetical protein